MAIGKLSSLGVGSSVLNYDVIEKLRKADENAMIAPVDRKLEKNIKKQTELADIKTSLNEMLSQTKSLSDYSTYIARAVNVSGSDVQASAAPGVPLQDINVEVKSLAKTDINEIGTRFSSRDDAFSKEDVILDFYHNGNKYRVDIKANMTLSEVSQAITDASKGEVIGVIMKTGGSKPFQLMINSKNTGEDSKVYFGSVLKSERLNDQPLVLNGEDDFYIEFRDINDNLSRISLNIDLSDKISLQDKAEFIRGALKDAISKNEDLKEVLENGDINIGLADEGRALLLNDRRGTPIKIGGTKAEELGFGRGKLESKLTDLYESKINAVGGKLDGVIKIGNVPIDLSILTHEDNTGSDNAEAIVNAVENIAGIHASRVQGRITFNSELGELNVSAVDEAGKESLSKLGLKPGNMFDYTFSQRNLFRFKNVQNATDADFTFNGARVKRSSNTINDVINGLSLTLVSASDKNNIISITQDTKQLTEYVRDFVKAYNESVGKLDMSTRYDAETKQSGIFNTESTIRNIRPDINKAFLHNVGVGLEVKSLVNYGIIIDDKSVMKIDESKFSSQINSDPEKAKDLFYGSEKKDFTGKFVKTDGVFTIINRVLSDLLEGENARLKAFERTLDREVKTLNMDKDKTTKLLDSRYDTMASRFAAYDEKIARANNSFNSVQMMIDQAVNAKKK